jgi:hypothetical protein
MTHAPSSTRPGTRPDRYLALGARLRVAPAVLLAAAVATAPAAATYLLVHARLDAALGDFIPNFWNDQVGYWHKIASFAHVGLDTGYYSPDEIALPTDAVRYGANGPWFPAVYGAVAAVVGWTPATSLFVNMAVLAVALVAYIALAKLDKLQMLVAGPVVLVLWPVLLYMATASQESLQQAIAILLAGVFVRAIARGAELSTLERVGGIAVLAVASVLRFSWAILLPCLLLLYAPRLTRARIAGALTVGALTIVALLKLVDAIQPRGNIVDSLDAITSDPSDGISEVARSAWGNAKQFLYPGNLDPTAATGAIRGSLDITGVQSWQIVGMTLLAAFAATAAATDRGLLRGVIPRLPLRESLFHVANLGATTFAALTLYLPTGYYRVLGAHLLLTVLVLVGFRRVAPVAVIAALNLIMFPSFLNAYDRWKPNFDLDTAAIARERDAFARLIHYDRDARNPWCNTLVLPLEAFDWRVTLVPPGIGVSHAYARRVALPPKSRYVLVTSEPVWFNAAVARAPLRPLGTFSAGMLYENRASACFRRSAT